MQAKKHNPTWEHIKLYIWVILIFELLLFCLALVFGKNTNFSLAFNVCFWMGLIIAVVFLSILLLNLLGIVTFSFGERLKKILSGRGTELRDVVNIYDIPDLKNVLRNADHVDVKTVQGRVSLSGFIAAMLTYSPAWLVFFYRIRKVFVLLLGMRQDDDPELLKPLNAEDISFQPGETASFFTVRYAEKDRYWIAETPDDKHLQAFVGIFKQRVNQQENRFHVMTIVHYKHWTGPVYFNVIRPFHHLVVKQMALAGAGANRGKNDENTNPERKI
jgi:hypothetical protein